MKNLKRWIILTWIDILYLLVVTESGYTKNSYLQKKASPEPQI